MDSMKLLRLKILRSLLGCSRVHKGETIEIEGMKGERIEEKTEGIIDELKEEMIERKIMTIEKETIITETDRIREIDVTKENTKEKKMNISIGLKEIIKKEIIKKEIIKKEIIIEGKRSLNMIKNKRLNIKTTIPDMKLRTATKEKLAQIELRKATKMREIISEGRQKLEEQVG